MNLLVLSVLFFTIYLLGRFLERLKLPWIFAALLLGLLLSYLNISFDEDPNFFFLSDLGLYFMLFIIGFEIDIKGLFRQGRLVIKSTILLILTEAMVGTLIVHFLFHVPWLISFVIALSFATIGEAVLLPILEDLKLVKTKVGQLALQISVIDDVFEVISIIAMSILLTVDLGSSVSDVLYSLFMLFFLFVMFAVIIPAFRKKNHLSMGHNFSEYFLLALAIFFLFVSSSKVVDLAPLGAILSGIALKNFVSKKTLELFENEFKTLAYGFFGPIFFFDVGYSTNLTFFLSHPLEVIAIMLVIMLAKTFVSYFTTSNYLGKKGSILLGMCLSVKFSTGIVVTKFFYNTGIINDVLYSVLIGINIWFSFVQPFIISYLGRKWKIKN